MNADIVESVTHYIVKNGRSDVNEFVVFNCWASQSGISLHDETDAHWVLCYIRDLLQINDELLKKALLTAH